MSGQQWRRFIPTGSQLIILGIIAVCLLAGVGFFNLATAKSEALARLGEAQARSEQLKMQRQELEAALDRAQRGEHIESQARRRFGYIFPGEIEITIKGSPAAPAAVPPTPAVTPPYWGAWWQRLVNP